MPKGVVVLIMVAFMVVIQQLDSKFAEMVQHQGLVTIMCKNAGI
jgi:hypothetical protein